MDYGIIKPNVQKYSCVNFPACTQLASDWFKNNQLLSDSHVYNIMNLFLNTPEVVQAWGGGRGGGCWMVKFQIDWGLILQ